MKFLYIMDPIEDIHPEKDTTYVFMLESQDKGHELFYALAQDISLKQGKVGAVARPVRVRRGTDYFALEEQQHRSLNEFDAVFMRKDPPYDLDYIFCTFLLEQATQDTFVINHPTGLRNANEKLYALNFPSVIPPYIISRSIAESIAFMEEMGGEMIIKPLDGFGGMGVLYVNRQDKNLRSLLEISTGEGKNLIICQKYLPEARQGDKRILLLNGEPMGAVNRVPQENDHRGNIHVGGAIQKTSLTDREQEICRTVAERLKKDGLYFVGLDVIGGYVTEINVTSPTCVQEVDALDGVKLESQVIDFVEQKVRERF